VNWTTRRFADVEVDVEPPPEARVERLGAVDVRHRDDDDLELHVHGVGRLDTAHSYLLAEW
jgi:hypothetical protein